MVVQTQVNELGMIRQSLYELEATHARAREGWVLRVSDGVGAYTRYESEIARLRRELEARGGSAAAIAGPGPASPRGDSERSSFPRPDLPTSLPVGPPLNGDSTRGELTEESEDTTNSQRSALTLPTTCPPAHFAGKKTSRPTQPSVSCSSSFRPRPGERVAGTEKGGSRLVRGLVESVEEAVGCSARAQPHT